MTDKTLGITASIDIQSVLDGLEELINYFSQIPDKITSIVDIEGLDDINKSTEEAIANFENITEAAASSGYAIENIDPTSLTEIAEASTTASTDLDNITGSADNVSVSLQAIDEAASSVSSGFGMINAEVNETTTAASNASGGIQGLASSFALVEVAAAALVSVGIVAWLDKIVEAAGTYQDRFLRLGVVTTGTVGNIQKTQAEWSSSIAQMKEDTGRGLGPIIDAITNLSIRGIESKDVMVKTFDAIAGAAFVTNTPVESLTSSFSRVISTGMLSSRSLVQLGLTTKDVMDATGKSVEQLRDEFKGMTPEQRALFMDMIFNAKYGTAANEAYKLSWEHVKDALRRAFDAIGRIIGQMVLPIVVPAIEFLTNILEGVADVLKNLNPVIKGIGGAFILLGGGLATITGLWAGFVALTGGSLGVSLSSITALLTGAAGATGVLGVALGPVGIAIAAIVASIGAAIYVWANFNKQITQFKDNIVSGDWAAAGEQIVDAFKYIGQGIWNSLESAGQYIWNFFAGIPAMIGNFSSSYLDVGIKIMDWIIKGLKSLATALKDILEGLINDAAPSATEAATKTGGKAGQGLLDGFKNWLRDNWPKIKEFLVKEFLELLPLLVDVLLLIGLVLAQTLYNTAQSAGSQFVSGLTSWFNQLPGRIQGALWTALNFVLYWGAYLVGYGIRTGIQFVSGFINFVRTLPGRLWGLLSSAIGRVRSFASQSPAQMRSAGSKMVSGLISSLAGLPGKVYNELMKIGSKIVSVGSSLYNKAKQLGQSIYKGLLSGLGIESPGYMYWAVHGELERMNNAMTSAQNTFGRTAAGLGSSIVGGFELNPLLVPNLSGSIATASTTQIDINHKVSIDGLPANVSNKDALAILEAAFNDENWLRKIGFTRKVETVMGNVNTY